MKGICINTRMNLTETDSLGHNGIHTYHLGFSET